MGLGLALWILPQAALTDRSQAAVSPSSGGGGSAGGTNSRIADLNGLGTNTTLRDPILTGSAIGVGSLDFTSNPNRPEFSRGLAIAVANGTPMVFDINGSLSFGPSGNSTLDYSSGSIDLANNVRLGAVGGTANFGGNVTSEVSFISIGVSRFAALSNATHFTNGGNIYNTGSLTNGGAVTNGGTVRTFGTTIETGLTNNGSLTNAGNIYNTGSLTNGTGFTNGGAMKVLGNTETTGQTNNGAFTNSGVMYLPQITYKPALILGAGNGNTNYTLLTDSYKMNLGSSNVNISAAMQTVAGQVRNCSVSITNLSADTWGISFSSVTNRWFFWGLQGGGTNAPTVLTNNTRLVLDIEFFGTNSTVAYKYLRPGLVTE